MMMMESLARQKEGRNTGRGEGEVGDQRNGGQRRLQRKGREGYGLILSSHEWNGELQKDERAKRSLLLSLIFAGKQSIHCGKGW